MHACVEVCVCGGVPADVSRMIRFLVILSTASVPAEAKKRAVSTPAAPQVRMVATIPGSLSALAEWIVFAGSVVGLLTGSGEAKVLATNVWATTVVTAGDTNVAGRERRDPPPQHTDWKWKARFSGPGL
jgi:hypothetical protein